MIYFHWSHAPWDKERWPNFHPMELASPDNGQLYWWEEFFDRLQAARTAIGKPLYINSGHRSWRHNLAVGGAPMSQHKKMAADISLRNHNRFDLLGACKAVGFTGFGYYVNFLHVDMGRKRFWYGGEVSKGLWQPSPSPSRLDIANRGGGDAV